MNKISHHTVVFACCFESRLLDKMINESDRLQTCEGSPTLADDSQRQNAAVLHALTVGALERDAAALSRVLHLRRLLVRHGCAPGVVGRVPLQDVTGSDHHAGRLDGDGQEEEFKEETSFLSLLGFCFETFQSRNRFKRDTTMSIKLLN